MTVQLLQKEGRQISFTKAIFRFEDKGDREDEMELKVISRTLEIHILPGKLHRTFCQ